jgi:hypothetical protein
MLFGNLHNGDGGMKRLRWWSTSKCRSVAAGRPGNRVSIVTIMGETDRYTNRQTHGVWVKVFVKETRGIWRVESRL